MYVAAGQANTIQKAVNRYILDRQTIIAAGSSATSGYTLTVPMLVSAGYLPNGFSPTNAYTATYRTLIFQPVASKFHSMTFLSGGTKLTLSQARKLASHIGATGGYIENGIAKGAQGGWQENLSAFGGYNPGDGSIVIAGFFSNGSLVNDYLYRHSVAGHPELNTMGTALDMGSNDITNAATISGKTVNASVDMKAANNITAGKNITAKGDVIANDTLRGDGDLVLGGVAMLKQVNTAGKYCDTWGAISRDSAGAVLSCIKGIWTTPGISETVNSYGSVKCDNTHGNSIAYCPAGYRLLSGGFQMTSWNSSSQHSNAPDSSSPDPVSNSWSVRPPGDYGGCLRAVALCAK